MRLADLDPIFQLRVRFNWKGNGKLPAEAGCYILASGGGEVIYIGQSNNLRRRMSEHLRVGRLQGAWFYYLQLPAERVLEYEQRLLSKHRFREGQWPALNRCGP